MTTTSENGIIHACRINGDGTATMLEGQSISDTAESVDLAWVHLDMNSPKAREWLLSEVDYLDDIIVDALLAEETRPRILEHEDGCMLILKGANFNTNADPEDMISIRMWVDAHRIISVQRRQLKTIGDILQMLKDGHGPQDSGDFIAVLANRLFERMEPVLADLDDRTDNIEERIIEDPDVKERSDISELRKEAIHFKRHILPQREVLKALKISEVTWMDEHNRRHLQESLDRAIRYVEDLDAVRERAQVIKDELVNVLSDRMNRNMYVLSVIAAIFLPLGFLTGLLGINVGGIPGADNPAAFWIFIMMMSVIVALQIYIFKKLKWF